jgi:hypothetical protein
MGRKATILLGCLCVLGLGLTLGLGAQGAKAEAAMEVAVAAPDTAQRVLVGDGIFPPDDEVPPDAQVCWCTNVGGVTVICPECDNEPDVTRCQIHDPACRAAAKAGGIREFKDFYCTTGH